MTAILDGDHADRARRALLDHLAESLEYAARLARDAVDSPDLSADLTDLRANAAEAADLLDTLAQFDPPIAAQS